MWMTSKEIQYSSTHNQKFQKCFRLTWKTVMNLEVTILKKSNVPVIVHFRLGKYSFSFETFWTHHPLSDSGIELTVPQRVSNRRL